MKNKIEAIFVIAGHSVFEPGAEWKHIEERTLNITIATDLLNRLRKAEGINVIEVGINRNLSNKGKIQLINDICKKNKYTLQNSLVIEIHCNSGGGTGIEVFNIDMGFKPGMELSTVLSKNISYTTNLRDRGPKEGGFDIITQTTPLACLVECGFIDSAIDREVLENNIELFSLGIYNGLKEYIGFSDSDIMIKFQQLVELYETTLSENEDLRTKNKILNKQIVNIKEIINGNKLGKI